MQVGGVGDSDGDGGDGGGGGAEPANGSISPATCSLKEF